MPFVKLDCGILNSTIWFEREAREVFITALLMAEPFELKEPTEQIETLTLNSTGWMVPPGWYGMVQAAGRGIINRAGIQDENTGLAALELLAKPEETSRSREFDGRRMVRVNGGFLILNYMKYRDRDYTARERQRRLRERRKALRRDVTPSRRNVTHSREQKAEADTESRSQSAETRAQSASASVALTTSPHSKTTNLINGADLRRHGSHAWCDHSRGLCVPPSLHDEFQKRGVKSDADMKAWYPTVIDALGQMPVGDDVFDFWRAAFAHWIGTVAVKPRTRQMTRGEESVAAAGRLMQRLESK